MADLLNPQARLEGDNAPTLKDGDSDWLRLATDAYEESETFMDASLRKQWGRNLSNFQSRHPAGSKYHMPAYKFRSRGFRPKTRAMTRNNEATVAAAFFSTQDAVSIGSEDQGDQEKALAAKLIHELCNYRLAETVPWFQIVLGAFQDTHKYGVCVSHQYWRYEERERETLIVEQDESGKERERTEKTLETVEDTPCIELRPPESVRISPAADWVDPINSSPYLIDIIPMYLQDVREMTHSPQGENQRIKWRKLTDEEMQSAGEDDRQDTTRRENQGGRQDPRSNENTQYKDHQLIWVHRNIARRKNRDWLWYTIGTNMMLSDPVPLERAYPFLRKRQRPYVMGCSVLDTHKTHPPGMIELTESLQAAANDISNQRMDNVRLAMNKRYFVRRNQDIDFTSLTRAIPGGVVQVNDIERDIKVDETNDVTGSAYQEQDRVNVDFDELAGEFSVGSVQSNRSLNETVGGMQLMQAGSSQLKEYLIKTFTETWLKPVVRQLAWLEATYETDENIISIAGRKVGLEVVPEELFMLAGDMAINTNVGMGATNPQQRIERFMLGLNALAGVFPDLPLILNREEVIAEVFGALGHQDGSRFFQLDQPPPPDPAQQQMEQEMALKQAELEQEGQLEQQQLAQEASIEQQRLDQEMAMERERLAMEYEKLQMQNQLAEQTAQAKIEQMKKRANQQKQASQKKADK